LTDHLGQTLTPEVAADIELRSTELTVLPPFLDPQTGKFWIAELGPQAVKQWIAELAKEMLALPPELTFDPRLKIKHTFLDGMYMREMFIPKGTLIIGKVHKLSCMNVVSMGDISLLTESGSARVKAGHSAVSSPGTQKVGYAHDDTVFINVFRTDETNLEGIEDVLAYPELETLALQDVPAN
jgi:hypothetical protein